MATLLPLLVNLVLLGLNERTLIDIGVDFDIRVIGKLQGIPLAVVQDHVDEWYLSSSINERREVGGGALGRKNLFSKDQWKSKEKRTD